MRSLVVICGVAALVCVATQPGDAQALFIKKSLSKAKKVVEKAKKKVVEGAKKAVGTVKDKAKAAVNTVVGGAKRLFQSAKAGVVNLAKKAKTKASALFSDIVQKGNQLFMKILGGHRRLHKNLLRSYADKPRAGAERGAGTAAPSSAGFQVVTAGTADVPEAMKKYASWYNYAAGDVQPAASKSRKDKQSLIKDQSTRGTCVAFATIAAMEAQISRPKLLSQEYLYWLLKDKDKAKICSGDEDGIPILDAPGKLDGKGIPEEVHYVYLPWRGFDGAKLCPAGPTGLAKKLANYKIKKTYSFPWLSSGKGPTVANPRFIEAAIDAGYDIVASFDVTFMSKKVGWFYDATVDPDTGKATEAPGGHAMLIVGYDRSGKDEHGGGHILVKNSWGAGWGDGGYVKLSYDYVRQYGGRAFIIDGVGK